MKKYLKTKIYRMVVSHNMPFEAVLDRYPGLNVEDIQMAIGAKKTVDNGEPGVVMGSKRTAYWDSECEYGTTFNPFAGLRAKDVEHEKGKTI